MMRPEERWPNDCRDFDHCDKVEETCKYANFPLLQLQGVAATAHQNQCRDREYWGPLQTLALSTMQVTVKFCSVPPQFRGRKPWGWLGASHLSALQPTTREDLQLDGYLRVPPPCRKGSIHLQTSTFSPGFEPSP
ncbi:hypothetical protein TNCV_3209701 [Trichonephila clavipes]|nr:hypothetical protein TNCV_3209701 [Trichonephila clavipes]